MTKETGSRSRVRKNVWSKALVVRYTQRPRPQRRPWRLTAGTDYELIRSSGSDAFKNAGEYSILLTGKGDYAGGAITSFNITRAALASADVTLASDTYTYNGRSQKPAVTVKHGGKKLVPGTDYSVTYSDNVHAGTASVKVSGKGNYKGTVTKKFTIAKADQSIRLTVDATKIDVGKTTAIKVSGTKGSISFKSASDSLAAVKMKDSKTGDQFPDQQRNRKDDGQLGQKRQSDRLSGPVLSGQDL